MTTTLKIVHTTGYTYSAPVSDSLNEIRMSPLYSPQQLIRERSLSITPKPWSRSFIDYWGTHVTEFELHEPHDKLSVKVTTVLDIDATPHEPSCATLDDIAPFADRWNEYLLSSPSVEPDEELAALAEGIAKRNATVDEIATALGHAVHEAMTYESGSTTVSDTAAKVWASRRGVCQDYSHILIGALRHLGIPARYVSGYVLADADAPAGVAVPGESHAWVQWFNGEWVDFDPTNDSFPGELHAKVGVGRDYSDVAPLRGIFVGNAQSDMFVRVDITRMP